MSQEIEQIEARLTAYIDGQLPEKERGEIEAYLASNPSHARLITELQRQRAQLRTLPRETAPAEIMDHLQAHLERHALLSDGDTSASAMKINRWPQFGAVAAMLVLAVGLGILVYQVLPSGGMKPEQMVLAPPSVQQLSTVPALSGTESSKPDEDAVATNAMGKDAFAPVEESAPSMAAARRQDRLMAKALAHEPIVGHEPAAEVMAPVSADSVPTTLPAGPLSNASALVVSSDDPALTRSLLASYLVVKGLAYEVVKQPLPAQPVVAATSEPAGAVSVASMVDALELQHLLPRESPAAEASASASASRDLIILRDVPPEQLNGLAQSINDQRDGRQTARLIGPQELLPDAVAAAGPSPRPVAIAPAQAAAAVEAQRMKQASTAPSPTVANAPSDGLHDAPMDAARGDVTGEMAPTTQASSAVASPGRGDVLVIVLAKPPAAPALPTASSKPTSGPAPLPVPPPKPVPMTNAEAAPATQPTTMP